MSCSYNGMKILIVDHSCHKRTNSVAFFQKLLMEHFEVETHYYDECYKCNIPADKIEWADVIVFWEFLPSRFVQGIVGKKCVFVPMYDNEWGSKWQWRRLAMAGMNVLSFCRRVANHAKRCGVRNLLEVKFSFNPAEYTGMEGDARKVILWERGSIGFSVVKKLFRPEDVDAVTVIRRDEERIPYYAISAEDEKLYKVEVKSGGFIPKNEYMKLMSEAGVFIAPRLKEGIGMAFLEQMAMGKCVIAHNDATMNEYIVSGKNGILVDMLNPCRVTKDEIENVRSNIIPTVSSMYEKWQEDKCAIIDFFRGMKKAEVLASPWNVKSFIMYLLYLYEGVMMRLVSRFQNQ